MAWRAKRQRVLGNDEGNKQLHALLHTGGISQTGLATILETLNGGAVHATRAQLHNVEQVHYGKVACAVDVTCHEGPDFTWSFADPGLLLGLVVRESEHMQDLYADALLKHGDGEWDLIVAWGEFTPGNKRRPDNRRKTMVLSYNFTQLGVSIRSDFTWMIPVTIRSCKLASIRGGFPRILKIFMEKLLFGPHGFMTAGVPLTIHGEIVVMKAHVRHLFSDGDGLRAGLDWKAMRPSAHALDILMS
jgi:hypothetical protein